MTQIASVRSRFHDERSPSGEQAGNPFRLVSRLSGPAMPSEIEAAWGGSKVPTEIVEMWLVCRDARLFEDIDYGQWGLAILDPETSAARSAHERAVRPSEFRSDDIVVGEFLGDQELLERRSV